MIRYHNELVSLGQLAVEVLSSPTGLAVGTALALFCAALGRPDAIETAGEKSNELGVAADVATNAFRGVELPAHVPQDAGSEVASKKSVFVRQATQSRQLMIAPGLGAVNRIPIGSSFMFDRSRAAFSPKSYNAPLEKKSPPGQFIGQPIKNSQSDKTAKNPSLYPRLMENREGADNDTIH